MKLASHGGRAALVLDRLKDAPHAGITHGRRRIAGL